jgi:hypothetical protein
VIPAAFPLKLDQAIMDELNALPATMEILEQAA